MAGLNDGWELEGEIPGANETGAEEPPESLDISEETAGILAFENSIADLSDLANDIEAAGGMSQDFAVAAESICPGVLSAKTNHFTLSPTATRLKISMEELEAGVWALIAAAVVAIIAIIYKIFKWLSGGKGDDAKDATAAAATAIKQQDENIANTEVSAEAMANVDDAIKRAGDILKSEGIEVSDASLTGIDAAKATAQQKKIQRYQSFDQLVAKMVLDDHKFEAAKLFLDSGDAIFHDILTGGDYTRMAEDAGDALMDMKQVLAVKMKLVDDILKTDIHSTSVTAKVTHLKTLNQDAIKLPITLKFRGNNMSMSEIARALDTQKTATEKRKVNERISFDHLFQRMASIYKKPTNRKIFTALRNSVEEMVQLQARMDRMNQLAGNLAHDGSAGASSDGVGVQVRQAILHLGQDVSGYAKLANELNDYARKSNYLAQEAVGFGTEIVRKISQALKMDGQRVPEDWEKITNELRKELTSLKNIYRAAATPKKK